MLIEHVIIPWYSVLGKSPFVFGFVLKDLALVSSRASSPVMASALRDSEPLEHSKTVHEHQLAPGPNHTNNKTHEKYVPLAWR